MMKWSTNKFPMGKGKGHIPIRTCISCRSRRPKQELIRFVLDNHGCVVRDDKGRRKGRGAYVCPDESCWEALKIQGRLKRAFRLKGDPHLVPLPLNDAKEITTADPLGSFPAIECE